MGYYTEAELPMYDFFANNFVVCDAWFSSHPGSTFANRFCAVLGLHRSGLGNAAGTARIIRTEPGMNIESKIAVDAAVLSGVEMAQRESGKRGSAIVRQIEQDAKFGLLAALGPKAAADVLRRLANYLDPQ